MSMLLCDDCQGWATNPFGYNPMFPDGECEDFCSLNLDHDGLCAERYGKRDSRESCTNCDLTGRLHEVDPADVDVDGWVALAAARGEAGHPDVPGVRELDEGLFWLVWDKDQQGPFPSPREAWAYYGKENLT